MLDRRKTQRAREARAFVWRLLQDRLSFILNAGMAHS
jgi:hypothetical protein